MRRRALPKLKVFISSAMGEEDGTKWMLVRESIKSRLEKCEYLEPFTIEEYAIEIPSTQFFTWQVTQTDIVVILIKNEIRQGTYQEIEMALEKNKPILVYFYNSGSRSGSAEKFKKLLTARDITTFKTVENFCNIEEVVCNDIINNLIYYYQFTHDTPQQDRTDGTESYIPNEVFYEDSILDKRFLTYFGENKKYVIKMLSLERYTKKNDKQNSDNVIGIKLLDLLYNGNNFETHQELVTIWEDLAL